MWSLFFENIFYFIERRIFGQNYKFDNKNDLFDNFGQFFFFKDISRYVVRVKNCNKTVLYSVHFNCQPSKPPVDLHWFFEISILAFISNWDKNSVSNQLSNQWRSIGGKSIRNCKKRIMLGTSDTWSMSRSSHRPSKPVYYIEIRQSKINSRWVAGPIGQTNRRPSV